jgi:purine-cytosine permease-like protein
MADKFSVILLSVVAVTILCGVLMGTIAIYGPAPQPAPIAAVFETLRALFTTGVLSIFGLLGSRIRFPTGKL